LFPGIHPPPPPHLRTAKLKPGNSGDLKVGWSGTGFSSRDSRQKLSFRLFFGLLEHSAAIPSLPSEHELMPTKHAKHAKGNSGRKVVTIPSRIKI
jgi:hypothetical protein